MSDTTDTPNPEQLFKILTSIGIALGVSIQRNDLQSAAGVKQDSSAPLDTLIASAGYAGIFAYEIDFASATELVGFVREGYPVVLVCANGEFVVLETIAGGGVDACVVKEESTTKTLSIRQISKLLNATPKPRSIVCKRELLGQPISASPGYHTLGHDEHHDHPTPLKRFFGLLSLDRRDIATVILFAFVAGVLGLATPLAIEALVNVVSWGTYLQPLIVLGLMLLTCLALAGVLKILQTVVVELVQRRQFVRIVCDLSHRFPRANQMSLVGEYPRELANRVFDIMTIQKATATLLLDGVSIVLTTGIGLVLLAFYHPFLLGFDIVLLLTMISLTWVLGRGGIRTAIAESLTKYKVVHWLQDVIASPAAFKTGGGGSLAVHRANQLTADYIQARQKQFRVVIRQVIFAVGLQVVASTVVLALGGWLVIEGQLTLGQLVASELVVTVVVGAFAKAGKSLEKFYDLMAGIDKVGHLIDVQIDPRQELGDLADGPAEVSWSELSFVGATYYSRVPASTIAAGSRVAITGNDVDGRSALVCTLAGLTSPTSGVAQVAGVDSSFTSTNTFGDCVGYVGRNDIFSGTLRENVDLGRSGYGQNRLREVLEEAGLGAVLSNLRDGLNTRLQTLGYPLTELQARKLVLARAILALPKLLIIDGLLDELSTEEREATWQWLSASDKPWTLIVNTNREDVASLCETQITIREIG